MSIGWDLPARWETILFLASATFVAYNIRVCLSVAVLDMKDALNWSDADKAWVLSSFYWGYAIGQLPAGWLTQQYGAKQVLAGSIFFPAILTMLIPVVSEYSYYLLLLVCALRGLFSSGTFPSCYYFFSNWVPKAEKTKLVTTVMGGNYLGSVSALSLSGFLAECNINIFGSYIRGWKVIFYFFGLMGVVWFPIWQAFGYDYPEDHPRCSAEELEIIKSGKKDLLMPTNCQKSSGLYDVVSQRPDGDTMYDIDKDGAHINDADAASAGHPAQEGSGTTIPWDAFVSHPASLVILYTFFTQNWIVNMLLSEIPTYFTEQLGFDSEESGILSIAPYLVQLASVVGFGHFFEYLHIEKGWTTREVRQWAQFVAFGGASTGLLICAFSPDVYMGYSFMVVALGFFGATQSGVGCSFLDVSPRYGSSLFTLANLCGAIAGLLAPIIVSSFTSTWKSAWGWQLVFIFTAFLCCSSLYLWCFYQTSDIVPALNMPRKKFY